jgi:hypothetical protein
MVVPLAVPAAVTSRHLPRARTVLSLEPTVQLCAALPLQSYSWTAVPLAELAPATSTHLPPMPVIGPALAALAAWMPRTPSAPATAVAVKAMSSLERRFMGGPSRVGIRQSGCQ